jgi:hypothetical protein
VAWPKVVERIKLLVRARSTLYLERGIKTWLGALWFMYIFLFILIVIIAGIFFFSQEKKRIEPTFPFRKQEYLLSIAEKKFYDVLRPIAEEHNAVVFVKVRLEDLLWTPPQYRFMRGYIKSRHIDFVLCGKEKINPICAIELNDASHKRADRIARDQRIVKIFASAMMPFLQIPVRMSYDPIVLKQEIEKRIDLIK